MKVKFQNFEPVEAGMYNATLKNIEGFTSKFGETLKWTFTISGDGSYTDCIDVTGLCSTTLTRKSKLYGWLMAFGINPENAGHEGVELDTIIGKGCMVEVSAKSSIVDGRETVFNNVINILPPRTI